MTDRALPPGWTIRIRPDGPLTVLTLRTNDGSPPMTDYHGPTTGPARTVHSLDELTGEALRATAQRLVNKHFHQTEQSSATTTPRTAAASLFAAVFNIVFEDDPRMTIALHTSGGSRMVVMGELDNYLMRFHPAEVADLLTWLTRAVATDPDAIITVTADDDGDFSYGWAWHIRTGAALGGIEAAPLFTPSTELKGAEEQHITVNGRLIEPSADGLSATALTDDVKDVVIAHAEPEQPAAGRRVVLRAEGAITIHISAGDVSAAREALEEIEYEDFDVDLRTRQGHLIGHITLADADSAELVSVDGTPADELDELSSDEGS
ncbi:hypothetical protein ACWC0C_19925 [Streptomyces sp. NPDC001709]